MSDPAQPQQLPPPLPAPGTAPLAPPSIEPAVTQRKRTTALHLLFDDPSKATDELTKSISENGVLKALPEGAPRLGASASRFVIGSVVGAIENVLSLIGVGGMLVGAWMNLEQVELARQVTKKDGGTRNVTVLTHRIAATHSPRIDLMVNEKPMPLMHLLFQAAFVLKGCDLVIENGEISSATLGHVGVAASLLSGGITVIQHTIEQLDLKELFSDPKEVAAAVEAAAESNTASH